VAAAGFRSTKGSPTADPAEGLVELNERFFRSGVGYQFLARRPRPQVSARDNPAAAPVSSGHRVVRHSGQRSASPACRCWVGHQSSTEFNKAVKHVLSVLVIAASLAVAASGRVQVQPGASPLRRHRPRLPRRIRSVPRCRRLCDARRACRPVRISHHQHKIGRLEHRGEHLATGNAIPAINPRGPASSAAARQIVPRFVADPPLEGDGFELSVPGRETVKPSWETGLLSRKRERICWGTEGSKRRPRDEMSLIVEGVVDSRMDVEKTLCGSRRLEPLHFVLSSPHNLMGSARSADQRCVNGVPAS
jgi:hypothetical protein